MNIEKSVKLTDIVKFLSEEQIEIIGETDRAVTRPASIDNAICSDEIVFAGTTKLTWIISIRLPGPIRWTIIKFTKRMTLTG